MPAKVVHGPQQRVGGRGRVCACIVAVCVGCLGVVVAGQALVGAVDDDALFAVVASGAIDVDGGEPLEVVVVRGGRDGLALLLASHGGEVGGVGPVLRGAAVWTGR